MKSIAEVRFNMGRYWLSVAGLTLAIESHSCNDVHMAEIAQKTDFVPDSDGVPRLIWTKRLLEEAAKRINQSG